MHAPCTRMSALLHVHMHPCVCLICAYILTSLVTCTMVLLAASLCVSKIGHEPHICITYSEMEI